MPLNRNSPYWGQAAYFLAWHSEKIPSAIERYNGEIQRVLGVLERWLSGTSDVKGNGQPKNWLVGDKMTIADMAFVSWNERISESTGCRPEDKFKGFPHVEAWHERMINLASWKACMEDRAIKMDEQGLMWNGMPKAMENIQE